MNIENGKQHLTRHRLLAMVQVAMLVGLLSLLSSCKGQLCLQSRESPSTEGNCEPGVGGDVCVQQINHPGVTYMRGEDFAYGTVEIDLEWCPDAECSNATTGRALRVTFILNEEEVPNADPIAFTANCQNRFVRETVENVQEITIDFAPNLSDENVACSGNTFPDVGFAKWEICPPGNFSD